MRRLPLTLAASHWMPSWRGVVGVWPQERDMPSSWMKSMEWLEMRIGVESRYDILAHDLRILAQDTSSGSQNTSSGY